MSSQAIFTISRSKTLRDPASLQHQEIARSFASDSLRKKRRIVRGVVLVCIDHEEAAAAAAAAAATSIGTASDTIIRELSAPPLLRLAIRLVWRIGSATEPEGNRRNEENGAEKETKTNNVNREKAREMTVGRNEEDSGV
ncbi:hypothetical protein K0M31_007881 [Melipona bicolor]|uniref:Uncharacterized protein n=1 Tax=Melipona bicolor TaxID=60889 RepID=A0AA40GDM1_9HYME|nr:hypothetical protein K0M31_007881 [Melipona bicolor]